jgi:hypothetical protein
MLETRSMEPLFDLKTNINVGGHVMLALQYSIYARLFIILQIFLLFFERGEGVLNGGSLRV